LERLIRRVSNDRSVVVIHVDKKSDDRDYGDLVAGLADRPSVRFLERHTCHWGGFGHVRATLKGISELFDSEADFDHVILLTGQDYPIKPLAEIHDFFSRNHGTSYMGHNPLPSPLWSPRGGLDRIEYRHLRLYGHHLRLPGKQTFPRGLRPFGGGAYWSLSRDCIEFVRSFVTERPDVVDFFKRVDIPDEIFFQTVIMNSELAGTVVNENLRHIDWSRSARPAVLGVDDLEALRRSPKLFARKFDVTHDERVLDLIDLELVDVVAPPASSGRKPPA
jgi:Core-2/I-Branching enzyme